MHRVLHLTTGVLLALACAWPATSNAQSVDSSVQLEQVRTAFVAAGYQVENPLIWEWMQPPVSTFRVHDTAQDRVLLVLVYPSARAAVDARLQAEVNDQMRQAGRPVTSGGEGPHLVTGYGPSTWLGNVALVETSESALSRAFSEQTERDAQMSGTALANWTPPDVAVHLEFIQALTTSVTNL